MQSLETLKIKLWDALWDFLTNILIQEGASHTQDVPSNDDISHSDFQAYCRIVHWGCVRGRLRLDSHFC